MRKCVCLSVSVYVLNVRIKSGILKVNRRNRSGIYGHSSRIYTAVSTENGKKFGRRPSEVLRGHKSVQLVNIRTDH